MSEVRVELNGGIITLDVIFNILADPRRRLVLYYLQDQPIATVEELAQQIIVREEDLPLTEVPVDDCNQVTIQLIHRHLPKMADATVIEYDPRSRTVRSTELPPLLNAMLRMLKKFEINSDK